MAFTQSFFESTLGNIFVFFTVMSIVLYYGPGYFVPSLYDDVPIVSIKDGFIKGKGNLKSRSGRNYAAYYGIPYARPPVGDLRFKTPTSNEPWEGVLEATSYKPKCPQIMELFSIHVTVGNENCLYLNVFVPESSNKKMPVMVWIHGGEFVKGETWSDNPNYFMDKDIIFVTISYRLGPLGFLNLGNRFASGNQGLHDQRLALKWVRKNIKYFGGNPEKVTLVGEGKSVAYHLSIKRNVGLIHSAIIQSGAIRGTPEFPGSIIEAHRKWTKSVGCKGKDEKECLIEMDVRDLLRHNDFMDQCNTKPDGHPSPNPWTVSVDKKLFHSDPNKIGFVIQVPLMIGLTSDEGLLHTSRLIYDDAKFDFLRSNLDKCLEIHTTIDNNPSVDRIRQFYFKSANPLNFQRHFFNLTNVYTDFHFMGPAYSTVKSTAATRDVYAYVFSHVGSISISDFFSRITLAIIGFMGKYMVGFDVTRKLGASNGDVSLYLFKYPINFIPRETDVRMSQLMIDLWTNFVIQGNPNGPTTSTNYWNKASANNGYNFVVLRDGRIFLLVDPTFNERMEFWESIIQL